MDNATQNKKLIIWAVTDNKPGHQNQTKGLINGLSRYRELDIQWFPVAAFGQNLKQFLACVFKKTADPKPDLIIGAGHRTHFSLLSLRQCFGGRTVVLMKPSLSLGFFDLCLIPRHDFPPSRGNVIETLGPVNLLVPVETNKQNPDKGLILLGGPSSHFNWDSAQIARQVLSVVSQNPQISWTIAGSRRTPDKCYAAIKKDQPEATIVLPQETSEKWLPQQIQESARIWITEDSISMIYEALTSGADTGIIALPYEKATRVTREVERLIAEGRVYTSASQENIKKTQRIFEADRCAKILLQKFGL